MSAVAFLVAIVIAVVAAGARAVVLNSWAWRSFVADVLFALVLLLLPGLIRV